MGEHSKSQGNVAGFLTALEEACQAQGVDYFDSLLEFLANKKGDQRDVLLYRITSSVAPASFQTLYGALGVHLSLTLRVIAPVPGLKITFGQAARLAEVQYWQLLPEPTHWHAETYAGTSDLLRRELVPYRLVFLAERNSNGKFHTWRPDRNLGGQVDEAEYFGPQDAIVLID